MRVSFGHTAYIDGTPRAILDEIERECNPSMTGDNLVCIDWDELPEENPEDATQSSVVDDFLWAARQEILEHSDSGDRIGDVVFVH